MLTKPMPNLENDIRWHRLIRTAAEAAKFIDALGYCVLYPAKNVPLPSLYYAVTHRDPRATVVWDKLSQLIWRWKDELPSRGHAVYVKYFRARGSFISLPMLTYFLAMSDVAVSPGDYDRFYSEGRIRYDARLVWEALATHGPLATLELRNACKMDTKAGNARFKRAIADLQRVLVVVHFGTEQETEAWASGRFELACRAFPKQTAE